MRNGLPLYCLAALVALVACRSAAQNVACTPEPAQHHIPSATIAMEQGGTYAVVTQPQKGNINRNNSEGASWTVASSAEIQGVRIEFKRKDITKISCAANGATSKVWQCESMTFCPSTKADKTEKYSVTVTIGGKDYVEDPEMVIYP